MPDEGKVMAGTETTRLRKVQERMEKESFGEWMVVERKQRRLRRNDQLQSMRSFGNNWE